jgi:hypothetical protein
MMHRSIRSIRFVFQDPSLGTNVKQVMGMAVLNFDFVIPFVVPFRFKKCDLKGNGLRLLSVQAAATG